MTVPTWSGRQAQRMVALCLATYGTRCHLCRHDGADSADHLTPRAVAPELTWQLDNLRPAHHAPCPTCGVRCNASRGAKPLSAARPAYLDATSYID